MKQMRLLELQLKNFKGIREFALTANGQNINVFGDNAIGKTTLFDAFLWLLFDKDSQNKKDFQIKTLDAEGNVLNGLDHEVEGTFEINSKKLTLRKVYAEKWTKQRGSADRQFTGHTTDYFIDGVPVKKNEYFSQIAEIVDEDIFKLLTSPSYFNEQLHWQKRREILLKVAGDITDQDVIASSKELAELPNILNGRKLEDHRKVIASKRTEINKELEKIPVRIDEVQRSLPDISGLNKDDLTNNISFLKSAIQGKEKQISGIQNGAEITRREKRILEIDSLLLNIKNGLNAQINERISEKREQLNEAKEIISNINYEIRNVERDTSDIKLNIEMLEREVSELRKRWHEVNEEQFINDQKDSCPTCGQALTAEQLESAREKALSNFNLSRSEKLEKINQDGKMKAVQIKKLQTEKEELNKKLDSLAKEHQIRQGKVTAIQSEISNLQQQMKSPEDSVDYKERLAEKQLIEKDVADIRANQQSSIDKVNQEIINDQQILTSVQANLSKFEQLESSKNRIEELKQQERKLSAEYEQLEGELYLTEQFIRAKVKLLEEKINSRFKHARFKLFDVQVNGGLNEVCETIYNGVPYNGGLNNAARINIGLDIISTLSDYYGFEAPIFIDNREAVTLLAETNGQVISLIVSEKDKKLRVVQENTKVKEAI